MIGELYDGEFENFTRDNVEINDHEERVKEKAEALNMIPINRENCRDCDKWKECECGEKGHANSTSQGYSIGECKEFNHINRKETWNGIHVQITAPKGTFEKIFNENDTEDDDI